LLRCNKINIAGTHPHLEALFVHCSKIFAQAGTLGNC